MLLFPLDPPDVLGGLLDGLPLLESGVVLGGFVLGLPVLLLGLVVVLLPELPVAELSVLPELPVVALPLLLLSGEVEVLGLLIVPLWPD